MNARDAARYVATQQLELYSGAAAVAPQPTRNVSACNKLLGSVASSGSSSMQPQQPTPAPLGSCESRPQGQADYANETQLALRFSRCASSTGGRRDDDLARSMRRATAALEALGVRGALQTDGRGCHHACCAVDAPLKFIRRVGDAWIGPRSLRVSLSISFSL